MFNSRKKLLSALVLAALTGSAALVLSGAKASAEVARLLQPNSSWAVSKIDSSQGGGAYCALARRYSNDIVLTFARNAHDESSVAIDFQKKAMDGGQDYRVTISPGYGQVRTFDMRPVSGKALVARLGQDYAFYDALNRSGRLDVTIAGEIYNFNLPDLNEGQDKLNGCLSTLAGMPPGGALPGVDQVQTAQAPQTSSVAGAVESVQPPLPMGAGAVSQPEQSMQAGNGDLEALRLENLRLRNALERERSQFENGYMSQSGDSSASAEMAERLRLLEIENSELRKSAGGEQAGSGALSAEVENLQNRIKELQAENARLASLFSAAAPAGAGDEGVKGDLAALNSRKNLERELDLVRAERDRLKAELDGVRKNSADARVANISGDNWDLELATRRYNEAERELQRIGAQLQQERASCAREKGEIESKLFDPAITEKEQIARLVALESELEMANASLKIQKDTYEDQIAHLKGQLDAANMQASMAGQQQSADQIQLEQELGQAQRALQTQKDTYENYIAELESKLAVVRDELARSQRVASAGAASVSSDQGNAGVAPLDPSGYQSSEPYSPPPQEMARQDSYSPSQYPGDYIGDRKHMPQELPPAQPYTSSYQPPAGNYQQPAYQPPSQPQQQVMTAPPPIPSPSANFMSPQQVDGFLRSAGITLKGTVDPVKSVGADGYTAYSWDTGTMFGSIEQHNMTSLNEFDIQVGQYLRKTESRCEGEFAAVPSVSQQHGTVRVESYEIACVGQNESASASILFFNRKGVFTTIAHETGVEGMAEAMDVRDDMIRVVLNSEMTSQ